MRQVLETGIPVRYRELPNPVDASKKAKATGRGTLRISARWNLIGKRWKVYFRNFQSMLSGICICFRQKFMESKGVSRQIGKEEIAQQAEIMEMAAKTENRAFINRNLHTFFRAAAGDGERSKTGDKRFTGKRSHTSAGKVSHDGWRAAPAVLEKVKVWI